MRELTLPHPRRARRITLVALVDLVIILLIFFMLRTNFLLPRQVDVAPATPGEAGAPPPQSPLYVELQSDGSTWVDGRRVPADGLPAIARARAAASGGRATVAVDPGVPLQRAVAIIDALQAAGLAGIDLRRARQFD